MDLLKDTFKYHVKLGRKVIARGVTYDLARREAQLQATYPGCRLQQVGRRTTHIAALRWERLGGRRPYRKVQERR